jgi:uncharacterized protein (TIGR00369 family)
MSDFELIRNSIVELVPNLKHCKLLGIEVEEAAFAKLVLSIPYSEKIIGNPETGVVHGGVLTTLMDTACGFAAVLGQTSPGICPTLDLRIDYMKPAEPGKTIYGKAEAYRVSRSVIFTRGVAYHEGDEDSPIAHCTASFMRLNPEHIEKNN